MTEQRHSHGSTKSGKAALSQDLSGFLIDLSIALNKHATYPQTHPSLVPASERVAGRAADLLVEKTHMSLGVAEDQLIIEGVATDPNNPVLNALAGRLHRHHLGAMMFSQGVTADEVHDVLGLIANEADRGVPLGLGPSAQLTAWGHIRLYAMTFDKLELAEEGVRKDTEEGEEAQRTGLSAQLWLGLARAALSRDEEVGGDLTEQDTDPGVIAAAIDANQEQGAAYDQVIVGYMMKIAEELKSAQGNEAGALKKRMSKLISTLSKNALDRLLEMGGNRDQRRDFLLNAAEGMTADAVLELVDAAGQKENQNVSNSMLRMLQKLSQHAEKDRGKRRQEADRSLRDQMSTLIKGWSLTDPNPDGYTAALQKMSTAAATFQVAPEEVFRPEAQRIFEMALEVEVTGRPVQAALRELIGEGELGHVLDKLDGVADNAMAEATWTELSRGEFLRMILDQEPLDIDSLDRVVARFGDLTAGPMLDVLVESESKATRRALIDRLGRFGVVIGPQVVARLRDPRWYVQRNMLNIIANMEGTPTEFAGNEFLQHSDPRVRREAMNILFEDRDHRERAICQAVADKDPRTVHAGLGAAMKGCPAAAIPIVVSRSTDASNEELQVASIRVLQSIGGNAALEALLRIIEPTRRFFRAKLPAKTKGYVAALRAAQGFASDSRVRKSLAAAVRSKDPEIAHAATTPFTTEHHVETI